MKSSITKITIPRLFPKLAKKPQC
ncbi:hypothetical protein AVDCRST_MAG94-104, partial [uncultured Leptolyngbya sp.]